MPTSRPRHVITETERVARALDDAAERWPAERQNRARLLLRLIEEGHRVVVGQQEEQIAARRQAIECTSGALTGMYGREYLARLREDWPE